MQKLELFGLTIIFLIVAAFLNTPAFFSGISHTTVIEIWVLIIFLILIAATTIARFLGKDSKAMKKLSYLSAGVLFVGSSIIFFTNSHYFWHGLALPYSFWHKVSFYTLPAIALESAIVTGFQYIATAQSHLVSRERSWVTTLFYFYTLTTMAVNFATIGGLIHIPTHLAIARIVIVTSIGIGIGVVLNSLNVKARI